MQYLSNVSHHLLKWTWQRAFCYTQLLSIIQIRGRQVVGLRSLINAVNITWLNVHSWFHHINIHRNPLIITAAAEQWLHRKACGSAYVPFSLGYKKYLDLISFLINIFQLFTAQQSLNILGGSKTVTHSYIFPLTLSSTVKCYFFQSASERSERKNDTKNPPNKQFTKKV